MNSISKNIDTSVLPMSFTASYIPYRQTNSFSKIVGDYLDEVPALREFYTHPVNIEGIKAAMAARKNFKTNRKLLVEELRRQYASVTVNDKLQANIDALLSEDSFTICTAHQPNIFTGHLYFIYKILHAIKLADELKQKIPGNNFIPVYYMGSEDADLEELGEVSINGKKYHWQTKQQGAVGRMKIDKAFLALINEIEAQLSVEVHGPEILKLVKEKYILDKTVEQATFEFVHSLFAELGLLIFLPDNPAFKKEFHSINTRELEEQFSHKLVEDTIAAFPAEYRVQAAGRVINLFYLKDDIRERIEASGDGFGVANTKLLFSRDELATELKDHPERFSQNVILRPVYQELVLPNIAFIGGGGELAYWVELKKVFEATTVPYPVLVLRNSFMILPAKIVSRMGSLQLNIVDLFKSEKQLIEELVKKESSLSLELEAEKKMFEELYDKVGTVAGKIDPTLQQHTDALKTQALKRVAQLEKKMLKAEKKKFEAQQRQINNIKEDLFPNGSLQERVDNLLPFYALYGPAFITMLYENSKGLQQEFCVVEVSE